MKRLLLLMIGAGFFFTACKSESYKKVESFCNDASNKYNAVQDCESLGYVFFEQITSMSDIYETIKTLKPSERAKAEQLMEDLEQLLTARQQELCGGLPTIEPDTTEHF